MSFEYECALCETRACIKGGVYPPGCPTAQEQTLIARTLTLARQDGLTPAVMAAAAKTPRHADGAMRTRVEETIVFCQEMGWTKVGVAFCLMLAREAKVLCTQLSAAGLHVVPVCCKVGAIGLPDVGVGEACDGKKGACNPMSQAAIMNENHTDVNVVLGLCVGHDLLFNKYSESPVTTLAMKDRALHHNPVAALRPVSEARCGGD